MSDTTSNRSLLDGDVTVGRWRLDPARTHVGIATKTFWGLATVKGAFTEVSGEGLVTVDREVTGTVTVAAATVDTGNAKRDKHLRSADFFDVHTFPTFDLTVHRAAAGAAAHQVQLHADLTIKAVREPLTLTADVTSLDEDTLAVHITGVVDRHRFGVSGNQLGMIKPHSVLSVDAVFVRAND